MGWRGVGEEMGRWVLERMSNFRRCDEMIASRFFPCQFYLYVAR